MSKDSAEEHGDNQLSRRTRSAEDMDRVAHPHDGSTMEFYRHDNVSDVLIIEADSSLNTQESGQFVIEIERLIDTTVHRIIIDCTRLEYISSYGMSLLLRLYQRMNTLDGNVTLCAVTGIVPKVLQACKLDHLFEVYSDVNTALAAHHATP